MADPIPTPLDMTQRETFEFSMVWKSGPSLDTQEPNSLNGYYARMQVRKRIGAAGEPIFDSTSVGPDADIVLEPDGETGLIVITIPAQKTALLTKPTAVYDLFIIDEDNPAIARRLLFGDIDVSLSATVT